MTLTPEQLAERGEFEAWLKSRGGSAMKRDGVYIDSMARLWFECWQAANKNQQARIAELEAKAGAGNEWRRAHDDVLVSLYESRKRVVELEALLTSTSSDCNATANERNELRDRVAGLERAACDALGGQHYMDPPDGGSVTLEEQLRRMGKDAERYRWLRDSTKCEAPGDFLNIDFDKMDAAIDAAMQPTWPEDASDYGSRIAAIGQNGNDGLLYPEQEGGNDGRA